jgi:hypothetical protein
MSYSVPDDCLTYAGNFGLISPFPVRSKVIIQEVWKLKIDWDKVIPEAICTPWKSWLDQFTESPKIKIAYWTGLKAKGRWYQLHPFVMLH